MPDRQRQRATHGERGSKPVRPEEPGTGNMGYRPQPYPSGAAPVATPLQLRDERLTMLNKLVLPLLRAARGIARLARLAGAAESPAAVVETKRGYTRAALLLELPGSHPLLVAIYTSAQKSRPLSPSQLASRITALRRLATSLRNKEYTQADIVYTVIAPRGFTRGAQRLAKRSGVHTAKSPEDAARRIAAYLARRYEALRRRIIGRRIWGPLPLLLYSLAKLAHTLGADIEPPDEHTVIRLAQTGGEIRG